MAVRIADKIKQYNDAEYMLVDASDVEYKNTDGTTESVQTALESISEIQQQIQEKMEETDNGIWLKEYKTNSYNLIAKIKLSDVALQQHVLSFSCLNQPGQTGSSECFRC